MIPIIILVGFKNLQGFLELDDKPCRSTRPTRFDNTLWTNAQNSSCFLL